VIVFEISTSPIALRVEINYIFLIGYFIITRLLHVKSTVGDA